MNPEPKPLELFIDVFDKLDQRALVLPELKPPQVVSAVLQEFQELEYLGADPMGYKLARTRDEAPLDPSAPLEGQVVKGERLALAEVEAPLPRGAQRPTRAVYLREVAAGHAYKLHWQPAIIGRWSDKLPQNELVLVDLSQHPNGQRVSRRHVRLIEEGQAFYVEVLASNPVTQIHSEGETVLTPEDGKHLLLPGDVIKLTRADIRLKFIVR